MVPDILYIDIYQDWEYRAKLIIKKKPSKKVFLKWKALSVTETSRVLTLQL